MVSDTCKFASLDELLANSEIISFHCPLMDSTMGIISKDTISKMKDGVMIVNTSRGPLLVEQDLCDALNSGKVAGAAVDDVSADPISEGYPLLKAKNFIITAHIAWVQKESCSRLMNIAADNLAAFVSGTPVNVVNL